MDKRHSERREEMQRLLILWQPRSTGGNISVTEDVICLFKQVARTIHYCFTPLLFLPKWRLQVARTRDPNMATVPHSVSENKYYFNVHLLINNRLLFYLFFLWFYSLRNLSSYLHRSRHASGNSSHSAGRISPTGSPPRQPRRPTDDHWHQSLCSAYLQVRIVIRSSLFARFDHLMQFRR